MNWKPYFLLTLSVLLLSSGCTQNMTPSGNTEHSENTVSSGNTDSSVGGTGLSAHPKESSSEVSSEFASIPAETDKPADTTPEILHFVDVFGTAYEAAIHPDVPKHDYDLSCFSHNDNMLSYEGDARYTYRLGVDVSYHEGIIDWEKIKAEGFSFAIIRIGARGYGKEGRVFLDEQFHTNIQNAKNAGLDVGVYFFSQAVNEAEAREEAAFVLEHLKGYELDLPVVYDPESILNDTARTDNVSGEQFTKNTLLFCELIENAGYEAMIYSNMLWEACKFDLSQLTDYPIWYADYEALPQTPYHFEFWQYTDTALIDGVTDGRDNNFVDLNIQLIPVE